MIPKVSNPRFIHFTFYSTTNHAFKLNFLKFSQKNTFQQQKNPQWWKHEENPPEWKNQFLFLCFSKKRRKIFLAFPSIFKPINPILVPPLHVLSSLNGWKKNLLINFRMKKSENKLSCWKIYRLQHFILFICRENVRKILNLEIFFWFENCKHGYT